MSLFYGSEILCGEVFAGEPASRIVPYALVIRPYEIRGGGYDIAYAYPSGPNYTMSVLAEDLTMASHQSSVSNTPSNLQDWKELVWKTARRVSYGRAPVRAASPQDRISRVSYEALVDSERKREFINQTILMSAECTSEGVEYSIYSHEDPRVDAEVKRLHEWLRDNRPERNPKFTESIKDAGPEQLVGCHASYMSIAFRRTIGPIAANSKSDGWSSVGPGPRPRSDTDASPSDDPLCEVRPLFVSAAYFKELTRGGRTIYRSCVASEPYPTLTEEDAQCLANFGSKWRI